MPLSSARPLRVLKPCFPLLAPRTLERTIIRQEFARTMISGMLQAGVRRLLVVSVTFLFIGSLPPYIAAVRYSATRSTLILIAMELPSGLMEAGQFNRISRALADPRRMEILQRIAGDREVACAALASESPVSQPTISHHLK